MSVPPPSGRSRSVSLSGPKKDQQNINSKEKLPMEVWTSENGLGIFASSLTSEKERGQGRKERKGRKGTGQKGKETKRKGQGTHARKKERGQGRKEREGRKETDQKGEETKRKGAEAHVRQRGLAVKQMSVKQWGGSSTV